MAELVIKLVNGELAGKSVQSITKDLNAAALAAKKAEVGTQAWVDANKKLEETKKLHGDLKKQIDSTSAASDLLKKAWNQLPGAGFFNQIGSSISSVKTGVGGLVSQFGVLKTAIAGTGIGLLVIVLAGLFNWLSKIETITNVVKGAWDGLSAAANVLFNAIATLDFTNLGDNMSNAAKEGYKLVKVFDDLEDAQRSLDLSNSQAGKTLDQLLLRSKNVQLSYKERLELLQQADIIEEFQSKRRLKYAEDFLNATLRQAKLEEHFGENEDDVKDKILAAKKAVIDAEREDIALREKIANRRSALEEKQIADQEKAAAAAQKLRDKKLKEEQDALKESLAVEENLRKLANENELLKIEDQQKREIEKLNQATEEKILALQGNDLQIFEQTKLLREIQGMELAAINAKYAQKEIDDQKKKYDEFLKREKDNADKQKHLAEEQAQFDRAIQDAKFGLASAALQGTVQLLGEDEKARKKNAATIKAFTIAQIVVDAEREIAGYYANPASTGTLGLVGTLKSLATVIRAGVAINKVNKQQFESGGEIKGPRHTGGGVDINAEGGEFMFSRKAVAAFGMQNLAAMNARYTFANGGPINPFDNSRGPVSSGKAGAPGADPFAGITDLKNTFLAYAEAMDKRIDRIQVNNNLSNTRKGLTTLNKLEDDANV